MHLRAQAIVLAVRAHGEHGAIVRALTPVDGMLAGYVRGGRSRRLRPILQPANTVLGEWRARTDDQLPQLAVEQIGRAACRERVWQYVEISGVRESLKKKKKQN